MRVVLACPNLHEPPRGRPKRARPADHDRRLYTVVKLSLRALPAPLTLSLFSLFGPFPRRPGPSASYPLPYTSRASSPFSWLFTHSRARAHTYALACAWDLTEAGMTIATLGSRAPASSTMGPVSWLNRPVIRGSQCLSTRHRYVRMLRMTAAICPEDYPKTRRFSRSLSCYAGIIHFLRSWHFPWNPPHVTQDCRMLCVREKNNHEHFARLMKLEYLPVIRRPFPEMYLETKIVLGMRRHLWCLGSFNICICI